MQVACEVRRTEAKNPSRIQPKDFILTFEDQRKKKEPTEEQKEMISKVAKQQWLTRLGRTGQ